MWSGGRAPAFFISALNEREWSAWRCIRFIPRRLRPQDPLDRSLSGHQSRSGRCVEAKKPGIESRSSSPSLYRLSYCDIFITIFSKNLFATVLTFWRLVVLPPILSGVSWRYFHDIFIYKSFLNPAVPILYLFLNVRCHDWPTLWSSDHNSWLQIHRIRVPFSELPDFLRSSGFGTGSTQPHEYNWGATWMEK
jgi:hypothetical protein